MLIHQRYSLLKASYLNSRCFACFSESVVTEAHSLVRGKESDELGGLEGFNLSYSVNIEMSPGFLEVFI